MSYQHSEGELSTFGKRVFNIQKMRYRHFRRDIAGIKQADQSTKNKKQE
jgi:hypothetical protein